MVVVNKLKSFELKKYRLINKQFIDICVGVIKEYSMIMKEIIGSYGCLATSVAEGYRLLGNS